MHTPSSFRADYALVMPVHVTPKALRRHIFLVLLLAVVALFRAERGVAELNGTASDSLPLLRVTPPADGEVWSLTLLGHDWQVPTVPESARQILAEQFTAWRNVAAQQLERIREALP